MKKVIIAVVILVFAFLVYNFAPTGYGIYDRQENTLIDFSPKEVKSGQIIEITVDPSHNGIDKEMSLHATNHLRKDTTDAWGHDCANAGRGSTVKCKILWTFDYRIPKTVTEPGQYYLRFYDYTIDEFVRSDYITIIE